ncbi:MAG TPA: hypothetical protein VE291_09185 [Terracidiphilus sp.]|nr:hypothetical protein [Terracidiphilus sp.]
MKIQNRFAGVLLLALCAVSSLTAQTKAFTISAANVTILSGENGSSAYTVANIPAAGQLGINCQYTGPTTTAKIPYCGGGAVISIPVTAGQTVNGTIGIYRSPVPSPAARNESPGSALARGFVLALAAPLLWGLRRRRAMGRWLALAAFCLVALGGISACGGSASSMTPGTYQYTLTADNEASSNTPLGQGVSTTFNVTVR